MSHDRSMVAEKPTPEMMREDPLAAMHAVVKGVGRAFAGVWSGDRAAAPAIPADLSLPTDVERAGRVRRLWSQQTNEWPSVRERAERLPRSESPSRHPDMQALSTNEPFLTSVEFLLVELGRRLLPWHGAIPDTVSWIGVLHAPDSDYVTHWMAEIGDELAEELPELARALDEIRAPGLQDRILIMCRNAVLWEVAVGQRLHIADYNANPRDVRGRPYADFENPFLCAVDLWRCGAHFVGAFMANQSREVRVFWPLRTLGG